MSVLLPYTHDDERTVLLSAWQRFAEARAILETMLRVALAGRGRGGATVTDVTPDGIALADDGEPPRA